MVDAILAGLGGLGSAVQPAMNNLMAIGQYEQGQQKIGMEKERLGFEKTRLGMEQEKFGIEKEKAEREKAIAMAPVNFSTMIGDPEYRDGAINGMLSYYEKHHPETFKQFHRDTSTNHVYGPNYLKQVVVADASNDAKLAKAVLDNLKPGSAAKAAETEATLESKTPKLLEKYGTKEAMEGSEEYKILLSERNTAKAKHDKIIAEEMKLKQLESDMLEKREIAVRHGKEATAFEAEKARLEKIKSDSSASIHAGASKYSADVHATSAEKVANINQATKQYTSDQYYKGVVAKIDALQKKNIFGVKPTGDKKKDEAKVKQNESDAYVKTLSEQKDTSIRGSVLVQLLKDGKITPEQFDYINSKL